MTISETLVAYKIKRFCQYCGRYLIGTKKNWMKHLDKCEKNAIVYRRKEKR